MEKLPPLNAVRAFEVAARTGSFTLAATELGVSSAAVSQQIRNLEDWFGKQLFMRNGNRIALTDAGHAIYPQTAHALGEIAAVGRRMLPKAESADEARACLALLSGRAHRVLTAVAALAPDGRSAVRLSETRVHFKRLTPAETAAYLAGDEWRGKAGGYAVQGAAGGFVTALNGSYSGVVGLPLYETRCVLEGLGYRR